MNDFFDYLKNPIPVIHIEKFTFNVYMKIIGLIYFLSFLTSGFIVLFKWIKLLPEYWSPEINSLKLFLAVTLFVPLIEEILFRLNLKLSKLNISVFLAVLTVVFFKLIFLTEMRIYIYLCVIPIFGLIYYIITQSKLPFQKMETFWKSNFKSIFHLCAITFGMLHLTNYETIYWWMIVMTPLLTAPHIASGYLLGYIRMKYGFIYGWLIHSTINFISVILTINKGMAVVLILTVIVLTSYYFFQILQKIFLIKN